VTFGIGIDNPTTFIFAKQPITILKERKKEKSTYNNNKNKDLKHKNNETVT
jgi:hypothetical protein